MRVFKTKTFTRWACKENITDQTLRAAVKEIESGLIEADLGAGLIKKRVSVRGQGKSGSARTLLAYQISNRAFFIYGFMKNEKENISPKELRALKLLSQDLLSYNDRLIEIAIAAGELKEVFYE